MAERGYMLTHADMLRLQRALQKIEQYLPDAPIKDNTGPLFVGKQDVLWASVTSMTQTSGRYPALLSRYDPSAADGSRWTNDTVAIWLESANGEPLVTGIRYQVALRGHDENRYVYVVDDVSGGAGAGILSLNDDEDQHQTIGITDDIAFFPETITGDNEMVLIGSDIAIRPWVDDRQYMTGWLTGHAGKVWRALKASEGKDPTIEPEYWVEVEDAARGGLHVLHIPKGRIYTPDGNYAQAGRNASASPVEIPAGQNFKILTSGSLIATSDSTTNELTLSADSVTVINNTNIYETNNYVENVFYFNTFNKTITILIDNEIFVFYADCCEGRQYYCMSKASVQACYNLLPSEYAVMLIEGYTKISGPHATKVICQTSCDGEAPKKWWCLSLSGVSGCYELTQAELLVLIDDTAPVYIPESGPHSTQAECLAACDVPDPIETDCCPDDPTPVTLYGVFSGADSGCECMNGVPFVFTYDAVDEVWWVQEKVIPACATVDGGDQLNLWCDAGTWNLDVVGPGNCPDPGFGVVTEVSCNPLVLTHTVTIINCGCGSVGTATLTISEVAP